MLPPSGHSGDPGPRRGAAATQYLWCNPAGKVSWQAPPGALVPPPPRRHTSPYAQPTPFTNNLVRTIEDIEAMAQQRALVNIKPSKGRTSIKMGRTFRRSLSMPPKQARTFPRRPTNIRAQTGARTASPYLGSPQSPCSQYTGRQTLGIEEWQSDFDSMLHAVTKNDPSYTVLKCHDGEVPLISDHRHKAWSIRFGNTGAPEHVEMIAAALKDCSTVRTVDFSYCLLGNSATKALSAGLNSSVVHFHAAGNSLRAAVVPALNLALGKMHFLQTINLRDNCIAEAGAATLAEGLNNRSALTRIDLGRNRVGTKGVEALALALGSCSGLREVGLFYNGIMDLGAKYIATHMKKCSKLEKLDLGANEIGDEGIKAICCRATEELYGWPNITTLELRANRIRDAGARALAKLLSTHPLVRTVLVDGNQIKNPGAAAIIAGLGDAAPLIVPEFNKLSPHHQTLARTTAFGMRTVSAELNQMRVESPTDLLQLTKKCDDPAFRPKPCIFPDQSPFSTGAEMAARVQLK